MNRLGTQDWVGNSTRAADAPVSTLFLQEGDQGSPFPTSNLVTQVAQVGSFPTHTLRSLKIADEPRETGWDPAHNELPGAILSSPPSCRARHCLPQRDLPGWPGSTSKKDPPTPTTTSSPAPEASLCPRT